jgi:hypothetical protein
MTVLLGLLLCSAIVFSGCIAEWNDDDDDDNEECEDWAYWNNDNNSTEDCPYDDDDDDDLLLGSPVLIQVTSTVAVLGIAAKARRTADIGCKQ